MTSEPMTPERHAELVEWLADRERYLAELRRLQGCTDPIECGHEAALGQAQEEVARLTAEVDEGRNVIEAVRSVTGGGRLPSEWSKTWRARAEKAEAALAEANETLAELAFAEDHSDEDRLRTERNEWMARAEKAEAELARRDRAAAEPMDDALRLHTSCVECMDRPASPGSDFCPDCKELVAPESSSPTEEKEEQG